MDINLKGNVKRKQVVKLVNFLPWWKLSAILGTYIVSFSYQSLRPLKEMLTNDLPTLKRPYPTS